MTRTFRELLAVRPASEVEAIQAEARSLAQEYEVQRDLRLDQTITQQRLADVLRVRQPSISKLDRQDDMLVSTLRRYLEALGGGLEIRARFPDRTVVLTRFSTGKPSDPTNDVCMPTWPKETSLRSRREHSARQAHPGVAGSR